jgi:hypothetical protein
MSVDTAGYGLEDRDLIPSRSRSAPVPYYFQIGCAPPSSTECTEEFVLQMVKWPELQTDQSPLCNAYVYNA